MRRIDLLYFLKLLTWIYFSDLSLHAWYILYIVTSTCNWPEIYNITSIFTWVVMLNTPTLTFYNSHYTGIKCGISLKSFILSIIQRNYTIKWSGRGGKLSPRFKMELELAMPKIETKPQDEFDSVECAESHLWRSSRMLLMVAWCFHGVSSSVIILHRTHILVYDSSAADF